MGTVLMYGLDADKRTAVLTAAVQMNMELRRVLEKETDVPVSKLLETEPDIKPEDEIPGTGPEIIYMLPDSRKEMDDFLGKLRTLGVTGVLKAVATPTNIHWTFRQLSLELAEEHRRMTGKDA